jgi:YVTN family beta-propeller protein
VRRAAASRETRSLALRPSPEVGFPRKGFVPSGTVWIIDLRTRTVVGTVTGVGNDPYGLALVEESEDD